MTAPRSLLGALCAALLVFGACSGSSPVSGFASDPAPIAADLVPALGDPADPDLVPEVQRRFLEACVKGGEDSVPLDLATVQRDGLLAVCGCTYSALVQYAFDNADQGDSEAAFERFSELDETVLNDDELPAEVNDLVRACIRSEAGI